MGRDLAQRAQRAAANRTGDDDEAAEHKKSLNRQIIQMQAQFQHAMPRGAEAGQLIRDAMTCISGTPKLASCDAKSVLGGLMTCAQLGLRPGVAGLGHAWLVPMWNGKERRHDATLIIGYRGYTELAYRHDKVVSIASRVVHVNDRFRLAFNLEGDILEHEPFVEGLRGDAKLFYAMARLRGGYALTEPWTVADMEAHRDKYAMTKSKDGNVFGPWKDHFVEMGRKTMVRNPLLKMIPISTELAIAAAVDEGVRVDVSPDVDPTEVTDRPVVTGELDDAEVPAIEGGQAPADLTDADAEAQADAWPEATKPGEG